MMKGKGGFMRHRYVSRKILLNDEGRIFRKTKSTTLFNLIIPFIIFIIQQNYFKDNQ